MNALFDKIAVFLQIYQEQVYDLLSSEAMLNDKSTPTAGLRLRWSPDREFYVENLHAWECTNAKQARGHFLSGMKKRYVASHRLNAASSRSHCIFTMQVERITSDGQISISKFSLVDLAGSERASLTGATGKVLQQSIGINKSLFVLRKVIKSLSQSSSTSTSHIPYRDSTLTRLLKHSLGGNCVTLMIACLCPADNFVDENLSTLNYAGMTKLVANHATINEDPKAALIRKLRAEIALLKGMLARAKQTYVMPTTSTIQTTLQQSKGSGNIPIPIVTSTENAHLQEQFVNSVNMIKELIADNNELREAYTALTQSLEETQAQQHHLSFENADLRDRIAFLESVIIEAHPDNTLSTQHILDPIPTSTSTSTSTSIDTPIPNEALHNELVRLREENIALKQGMMTCEFELQQMKKQQRIHQQPQQPQQPQPQQQQQQQQHGYQQIQQQGYSQQQQQQQQQQKQVYSQSNGKSSYSQSSYPSQSHSQSQSQSQQPRHSSQSTVNRMAAALTTAWSQLTQHGNLDYDSIYRGGEQRSSSHSSHSHSHSQSHSQSQYQSQSQSQSNGKHVYGQIPYQVPSSKTRSRASPSTAMRRSMEMDSYGSPATSRPIRPPSSSSRRHPAASPRIPAANNYMSYPTSSVDAFMASRR